MELLKNRVVNANPDDFIVQKSPDKVKMSDVLKKFVEPIYPQDEDIELRKNVLILAVIAWNIAVMEDVSPKESRKIFEDSLKVIPIGERMVARRMVENLAKDKKARFPHIKRLIVDFELTENDDEEFLSVVSSHPLA